MTLRLPAVFLPWKDEQGLTNQTFAVIWPCPALYYTVWRGDFSTGGWLCSGNRRSSNRQQLCGYSTRSPSLFLGHSCTDKGLGKYCTMNDKHRASTALLRLTICLNTQCLSSSTFGFNGHPSIFNCHSRHPPPSSPFTLHSPEPLKSGDSASLFTPDHSSPSAPPIHPPFGWQACLYKLGKNRERERQREKWDRERRGGSLVFKLLPFLQFCQLSNTRGGFKRG